MTAQCSRGPHPFLPTLFGGCSICRREMIEGVVAQRVCAICDLPVTSTLAVYCNNLPHHEGCLKGAIL